MNKIISVTLLVGAIAVSGGVAYTLDRMSQASEQNKGNLLAVSEDIHNLRQLDGEWSLSVLRSLVTDSDFDEVAGFLPRLRELRASLASAADAEASIPDNLKNRLFRFLSLIEAKEQTVEQFKTNFAVVRNSEKFLPVATRSLMASAAQMEKDGGLGNTIRDISDRTSAFSQRPDEGSKVRVLASLSEFEEKVIQYPPELGNALHNYISHARIILERRILLNEIVTRVLGTEVAEAGTELSSQFRSFAESLNEEVNAGTANLYKQSMILILALGLIAVAASSMYGFSAFNFDKRMKLAVSKRTEELEKELENNASKSHSGPNMGSVSSIAGTIANELGNPISRLGESLDAIRTSADKFQKLKAEVDRFMHAKAADNYELINNLKNISTLLDTVSDESALHDVPDAITEMYNNIQHVQAFTGELRNLSQSSPLPKDWYDVNEVVEATVAEFAGQVDSNIDIKAKVGTVPEIYGSAEEMKQSLSSMIANAVDAIKAAERSKGQIMVSTKKHNDRVVISVVDNGKGMDDETRNHVFEPFFSTKDRNENKVSGLGLCLTQKLVMQNDGKIVIKSIPDKGTNFSIVLPVRSKQQAV